MRGVQGNVPLPQLHHRPHCPSKQGRYGPPGQSAATLRGVQLAEGGPAAGVSDGAVAGDGDVRFGEKTSLAARRIGRCKGKQTWYEHP